jgi:hypothetical protein
MNKRRFKTDRYRKQNGKCVYCQKIMVLLFGADVPVPQPKNLATIEHLDDKFSPFRGKGSYRRVLACHACNSKRNVRRLSMSPEERLAEDKQGVDECTVEEKINFGETLK